jgi:Holliday junction resolvasome RuvABC endonuclease subunit
VSGLLRVLGLDPSLTATGIADANGRLLTVTPRGRRGPQRLAHIRDRVLEQVTLGADLVAIEGYSYASKGSSAYQLGELGGVIRLALWEAGVPFAEVPPSCLKKYAAGTGNASKDEVLVACVRRLDLEPRSNNESDAAWLRAMALDHFGQPLVTVPKTHRAALDSVTWPALARRSAA